MTPSMVQRSLLEKLAEDKGCDVPSEADTDHERINVFTGLLLAAHLDAAFDRGFIALEDGGRVLVSPRLSADDAGRLGAAAGMALIRIDDRHRKMLSWHRVNLFQ